MRKTGRVSNEETADDRGENFQWLSSKQHMLFFFSYLMDYTAQCCVVLDTIHEEEHKCHKCWQLLIVTIFVGAPILFLQTSIGQYTRNSCLILGEMFPVFNGIGYCMLFLSLCELGRQMFYTTKFVCYFIVIISNTSLAWMKCYKHLYKDFPNCISRKDLDLCGTHSGSDTPCFKPHSVVLSAEIFKEGIAFGRLTLKGKYSDGTPMHLMSNSFFKLAFCLCNSVIVLLFLIVGTSRSARNLYTTLKASTILCIGLLCSIWVTLVIQPGISWGMSELHKQFTDSNLLAFESWAMAITTMVTSLKLAQGGHILFGSYIPEGKPDFWQFLYLIGLYLASVTFFTLYYYQFLGLLIYKLSMQLDAIIPVTEENVIFVLFPTFLGILPSCVFAALVFFAAFLLLNLLSMVVKIIVLEQEITKYFVPLVPYSVYIRYTICILIVTIGLCMEIKEVRSEFHDIQKLYGFSSVSVVAVQQIMVIVYGIQNVFDDFEYIMKIRLKIFLQLSWIVTPLICMVSATHVLAHMNFRRNTALKVIYGSTMLTPLVIALIVQILQLAKRKNLIGLLRPTELYGRPDLEDKIFRILYNNRLRVRYRRKNEDCPHECLLKANAVKTVLEEELKHIMSFENELKFSTTDKAWEKRVSLQFKKHEKYLLRFIKRHQTTEKFQYVTGGTQQE